MKRIFLFLSIVILVSCEEKADYGSLFLSKDELKFPAEGGTLSFHIDCDMSWDIIGAGRPGIEIEPKSGNGNQDIYVTVQPNILDVSYTARFSVRAKNGVTKAVNVCQLAQNNDGCHIDVTSSLYLEGKSRAVETIAVIPSEEIHNWEMKPGPDWLEISFDGSNWFPSSKGATGLTSCLLYVRTTTENKDDYDRNWTLAFKELYHNTIDFCNVVQLGRLKVKMNHSALLSYGFACDWLFGCDIDKMYLKLTETEIDAIQLIDGSWLQKKEYLTWDCYQVKDSKEKVITMLSNLKENTFYYLYRVTTNREDTHVGYLTFRTRPAENQAYVSIESPQFHDEKWTWQTVKSNNTAYYYLWVTDRQELFTSSDELVALYASKDGQVYSSNMTHTKEGSGPYMIVTYATDSDFRTSGVIKRLIIGN
ncbi:MAG: BACON domain-containing protein [Prevotella sp.]|nr:BACON domain-containing protein [Prevotella sp.]